MAEKQKTSSIAYSGAIQIDALPWAQEMPIMFPDGYQRNCLVIPIDGNPVVKRGKGETPKIIAGINVFKNDTPDKFGQTHYFRFSLTQEAEAAYTEEQRNQMTRICGNCKPVKKKAQGAPAYGAAPMPPQGYGQGAPAPGQYPAQGQPYPQQQGYGAAPVAPQGQRPVPGIAPQPYGPSYPSTPYNDMPADIMDGNRGIIGG